MIYRNIFAERLILLRKERNLYQKDIADVLGVTKNAITKLEKAQRSPSFEVLVALADYFNVTLDYLVGRVEAQKRLDLKKRIASKDEGVL
nr:helix-turn-helix transcriptional regulator [uncultured Anaeromusa sp.]